MKGFTKCPNGHYYKEELAACPYCRSEGGKTTELISSRTQTETLAGNRGRDDNKTRIMGNAAVSVAQMSNRTVFGEETVAEIGGKEIVRKEYRDSRKLVGWLVTYSFDRMGADFRLYEGRNVIGHDMDCNITVPDRMVSGKHATILFKNDRYKIKDELSSHGTYVNERDIEDEHVELFDNDSVRLGETVFKFRTSL
jgi:hypothetical protein